MTGQLTNKVAVVTGGSSGIGLAIAERFVKDGAFTFIVGRRQSELDDAARRIGRSVATIRADTSLLADLDSLYAQVRAQHRGIDVLVANAGGAELQPLGDITEDHFDRIFSVNVKGVLFTVQKALPLLNAGASVILTGSTLSLRGAPALSVYGASKAAVRSFARHWILDLKGRGIRVNVLSPGATRTPGLLGLVPEAQSETLLAKLAEQIPLGRICEPEEVGEVAAFLASDSSRFIHGVELFVDGGYAQI